VEGFNVARAAGKRTVQATESFDAAPPAKAAAKPAAAASQAPDVKSAPAAAKSPAPEQKKRAEDPPVVVAKKKILQRGAAGAQAPAQQSQAPTAPSGRHAPIPAGAGPSPRAEPFVPKQVPRPALVPSSQPVPPSFQQQQQTAFPSGPARPSAVTAIKGKLLRQICKLVALHSEKSDQAVARRKTAAETALASGTRSGHRAILHHVAEKYVELAEEEPTLDDQPLDVALLRAMDELSKTGIRSPWIPASLCRRLTSLHGALKQLPYYTNGALPSINMTDPNFALWKSSVESVEKMAAKEHAHNLPAANFADIKKAMANKSTSSETRTILMLLCLSGGRFGCIRQLVGGNVVLQGNGDMTILFESGKRAEMLKRKFAISTHCPQEWRQNLREFLDTIRPREPMFSPAISHGKHLSNTNAALRSARKDLTTRSTRRGALQQLSTVATPAEMLKYSGHTNLAMLNRYLNDGLGDTGSLEKGFLLGKALTLNVQEVRPKRAANGGRGGAPPDPLQA